MRLKCWTGTVEWVARRNLTDRRIFSLRSAREPAWVMNFPDKGRRNKLWSFRVEVNSFARYDTRGTDLLLGSLLINEIHLDRRDSEYAVLFPLGRSWSDEFLKKIWRENLSSSFFPTQPLCTERQRGIHESETTMESLLDQLSELRHLPSTVNPYQFLASKLASEILPQVPKSAINQLYFVAATLAV